MKSKKIKTTLLFLSLATCGMAQSYWDTKGATPIDALDNAVLGPKKGRSLNIITNDSVRIVVDSLGRVAIPRLGFSADAASIAAGIKEFVMVDQNGILAKGVNGEGTGFNCGNSNKPWLLGGNLLPANANANLIGPCNNYDFILQAHGKRTVFITDDSKVGIGEGNDAPSAILDISDPDLANGSSFREHLKIYGDGDGTILSTFRMNLYYAGGTDFNINEGDKNSNINRLNIANGIVSVNGDFITTENTQLNGLLRMGCTSSMFGSENFAILGTGNTTQRIMSNTASDAGLVVANSLLSYKFFVGDDGYGHITNNGSTFGNSVKFLNFVDGGSGSPKVWIGNTKPSSPATTDFMFGVAGKLVAKSIYVTADNTTNWADYVFAPDYKLPKLADVETYYKANRHLPEIPSAKEVADNGIDLAGMNVLLLKKVEELTLYVVEQQKIAAQQQQEIEKLKKKIN